MLRACKHFKSFRPLCTYTKKTMESISREARLETKHPDLVQLYSAATPNGMKAAIVLEELVELNRTSGLDFNYEPHTVNIRTGENRKPDFLALTPNAKIPVVFDPHGNENSQIRLFESGAILLYLAEKYGELLPKDVSCRYETIQWLFWASTSFSAQVKLFGFYYKHCVHKLPYCIARYSKEVDRLLAVLEFQLSHDLHFLTGEMYTIADIAAWPWVHALFENYDNAVADNFNNFGDYPRIVAWYQRVLARPAVQRALGVTLFVV